MGSSVVHAIVLAGGKSERMGTQKLAIKLGSRTVLERVVDAFQEKGIESVLVVLGPTAFALRPLVERHADVLLLPRQTLDMRSSLEQGLNQLEKTRDLRDFDGVLVGLGDQPTIQPLTVNRLVQGYLENPGRICVPTHGGRRGHPPIVPWNILQTVRTLPPDQGLNAILRDAASHSVEVPVDDPDVLLDLDEPVDLERLSKRSWD